MQDPIIRHSYVQINNSFVHLVQYGCGESLVKSPSNTSKVNVSSSLSTSSSISSKRPTPLNCSKNSFEQQNDSLGNKIRFKNSNNQSHNNTTKSDFSAKKSLIVFIPGNPGILGIYHDFLVTLFRMISTSSSKNGQPTIIAIGHNNFDHPDHVQYRAEERICVEENDLNFVERALATNHYNEPHHIELQILNKLIILKRLLRVDIEDCRLVLIGHSVGCYVILRLLQDRSIASCHEGSILIHPALENIALTVKGSYFDRMFSYKLDYVMRTMALVFDKLLPKSAKLALTRWYCSPEFVQSSSQIAVESVSQIVCQKTLNALIQMAKSEFALVKNMNTDSMIKPHVSKLKLVYAINDQWVNTDNRRMLRDLYPDLYMEEQATLHAFMMCPQTVMDYAIKIGMFIQDFIDNIDQADETGYVSSNDYTKI